MFIVSSYLINFNMIFITRAEHTLLINYKFKWNKQIKKNHINIQEKDV